MKERSILFSGEMVKAILDGRKTQTRRVVKKNHMKRVTVADCPYGTPGDRLWVRERWTIGNLSVEEARARHEDAMCDESPVYYYAEEEHPEMFPHWLPSIHMPRWASRVLLEVTAVRVQRVQDISVDDIEAEGVAINTDMTGGLSTDESTGMAYDDWRNLWDSINAKRGYGWDVNPWVWAITFKRIERGDE